MSSLKPNYTNFKSTRNYIKYNGLKKHLRQKPNLTRHQCEVCNKTFKSKMMIDFHKRIHPRQLLSKDCENNLKDGNKCKYKSECEKKLQLPIRLQTGEIWYIFKVLNLRFLSLENITIRFRK